MFRLTRRRSRSRRRGQLSPALVGGDGRRHLDPANSRIEQVETDTRADRPEQFPPGRYKSLPRGEFGIHNFYVEAIRRAERLIYLETQYLPCPEVMDALIKAMEIRRKQPFRIVVVLPARATSGKWDNDRHVNKLRNADAGRGIAEVYSLYSSGPASGVHPFQYRPTYVHAKVGIFDDEWLTVGSANLNDRGLVTDSEMNVVANDSPLALATRTDLWGRTPEPIQG